MATALHGAECAFEASWPNLNLSCYILPQIPQICQSLSHSYTLHCLLYPNLCPSLQLSPTPYSPFRAYFTQNSYTDFLLNTLMVLHFFSRHSQYIFLDLSLWIVRSMKVGAASVQLMPFSPALSPEPGSCQGLLNYLLNE